MRYAVTGGTGFVGAALVARLVAEGAEVTVLSRRPSATLNYPPGVSVFPGDLSDPAARLEAFVDGADVLIHGAGEINDEARMRAVHVDGTARLAAAAAGRIGRWVQLSSTGAYGPVREGVVTEETPERPVGEYEVTKTESDRLVWRAHEAGDFPVTVLRPSIVYGEGMRNRSLFQMIAMIQRGLFFFVGPAGATANYIHVENVAEALLRCARLPQASGRLYNLSDHRSLEEFTAAIAGALGRPAPRLRLPEWPIRLSARLLGPLPGFPLTVSRVDALTSRVVYSAERIARELGYSHGVSMEEGIERLVDAWKRGA